MHAAQRTLAVVGDAAAAVHRLVVAPGLGHAVMRIDRHGGAVAGGVVAPVVVGVGEDSAGTVGTVGHVGGVAAAAQGVAHLRWEELRVGTGWVRSCRSQWRHYYQKTTNKNNH